MNKKSCKTLPKGIFILIIIVALLIFITNMNNDEKNIPVDQENIEEVEGEETTDVEVENSDASYLPEE